MLWRSMRVSLAYHISWLESTSNVWHKLEPPWWYYRHRCKALTKTSNRKPSYLYLLYIYCNWPRVFHTKNDRNLRYEQHPQQSSGHSVSSEREILISDKMSLIPFAASSSATVASLRAPSNSSSVGSGAQWHLCPPRQRSPVRLYLQHHTRLITAIVQCSVKVISTQWSSHSRISTTLI